MKFSLADYHACTIRAGGSTWKLEQVFAQLKADEVLVTYTHDVDSYYYVVPKIFEKEIGSELLSFFKVDNEEYSEQDLLKFKLNVEKTFWTEDQLKTLYLK